MTILGNTGELVVYPKKTKLMLIALGGLTFVGLGGLMLAGWMSGRADETIGLAGAVGLVFFGACTLYALYRLFVPRPALVIDEQGLVDNGSAVSVGFLRWEEIETIGVYEFQGQTMLGIVPRDLDSLLKNVGSLKKMAIKANVGLGAAPINVPQSILPVSAESLVEQIHARYRVGARSS